MTNWPDLHEQSRERWDAIADYWDGYMGEHSNRFHRELIRPHTASLLNVNADSHVLDIACGNGNYARYLAEMGAKVTGIDYSSVMIERAEARTGAYENISYRQLDATHEEDLLALGESTFSHAVSNMGLMDISDVRPLAFSLYKLLQPGGVFVFSICHPSFQTPTTITDDGIVNEQQQMIQQPSIQIFDYLTATSYTDYGIKGQAVPHFMFHRPLHYYMNLFFEAGFVLDSFLEPSFQSEQVSTSFDWINIPAVALFRFRKL